MTEPKWLSSACSPFMFWLFHNMLQMCQQTALNNQMEPKTASEKLGICLEERKKAGSLLLWKFILYPEEGSKENGFLELKYVKASKSLYTESIQFSTQQTVT